MLDRKVFCCVGVKVKEREEAKCAGRRNLSGILGELDLHNHDLLQYFRGDTWRPFLPRDSQPFLTQESSHEVLGAELPRLGMLLARRA